MKYLIQVTETYRVDSEEEAKEMIEEAKTDNKFQVLKYTSQYKERKAKGEVIDAWYKLTFTKGFTEEREPELTATINYEV